MTSTRKLHASVAFATTALVALTSLAVGCGSSVSKTAQKAKTADATDSAYCKTARKWMVHEFNGDGDTIGTDPVAFKKYWHEYLDFVATATRQAPSEIRADWPASTYFVVRKFTPLLEKYDYDIKRIKAEGSPTELAVGERMDKGPSPAEQRAQDAVHAYEGRVCNTAQPEPANVSFAGVKADKGYCDAVQTLNNLFRKDVVARKVSIEGLRTFVNSAELPALADKVKKNAPPEIKADVVADVEWTLKQWVDVAKKYGYDARKLFLEGTAADQMVFQHSDPAVAKQYARTAAYERQLCGS